MSSNDSSIYAIPVQHAPDELSFDLRPKKVKEWFDALPMANLDEVTRLVSEALSDISTLQIKPSERYKLLEQFHPLIQIISETLQRKFVGRPLPLSDVSNRAYSLLQEINILMAVGYKTVIVQTLTQTGKRIDISMITYATHRNMRYLSTILMHAYQIYGSYPTNTWKDIHQLYSFATQNKISETPVKDQMLKRRTTCTVEDMIKRTMLLSLACPYRLHQGEVDRVYQMLEQWVRNTKIGGTSDAVEENGIFVTQLDLDAPPTYRALHKASGDPSQIRILDTTELADDLQLQVTENGEDNRVVIGETKLSHDLLRRLALAWGIVPKRGENRLNISTNVEITSGINAIYYHISGINPDKNHRYGFGAPPPPSPTKDEPIGIPSSSIPSDLTVIDFEMSSEEREKIGLPAGLRPDIDESSDSTPAAPAADSPYPTQNWNMVNVSAGGYCLLWNDEHASTAKVGELIGIHNTGEEDIHYWGIGVVRWMRCEESEGLKVGVQMLSPSVISLSGSRYFCGSLFWASKPKQTAKTSRDRLCLRRPDRPAFVA
ncbi:hypothetical protein [Candidatus Reidiella endopervernicosa]|uniref:PilZ domain-containing protein n=1 Tax=Candidatus Reidiella endopervernicosa TaxID=2738883 RepID=A0A6N0HYR9_9GAMM|nr:hypothetical protein [Candidatus Reidiella endopervernicosa]QKQ27401.1 hypothetical protein HUE57_14760 [Candidatus Reidiella endopervernicosa]